MTDRYPTCRLGAVATVQGGFAFKSADFTETGVPVLKIKNIRLREVDTTESAYVNKSVAEEAARYFCKTGDLLISMTGSGPQAPNSVVGRVARFIGPSNRYLINQRVGRFVNIAADNLDQRYLFYVLAQEATLWKLVSVATGSANQANISGSQIESLEVPLPPLAKQKAIAAVLAALDDKIELNRRMNVTLETMARALFQSWFVDFDPVRAKLDGRIPAGLDPESAALFPEHFTHSEHDILPVGWRRAAIEEVCAINAWTLGKNDDLKMLEYIEISEVSRGNIANITTYPRGEEPSRARRRLRHGDTGLSTVRPDRGSYFLTLNPPENRVASTGFAVLTPKKVPWSFVHAALTQAEVSDHLGQMADGGAYPAVRPEIIGAIQIALPDEPEILEAFHRICAPFLEQAEANRIQSRTLDTLRDTLLPELLSGELSVENLQN